MSETPPTAEARYAAALAALTAKQRAFVVGYVACLNATEAARRAKYPARSAASIGWENLRKPEIAAAIDAGFACQAMPPSEILARLAAQARGDMGDFLQVDEEDITLTWSLISVPTDDAGDPDIAAVVLRLASQENVRPTDRVLHTATVKRAVARLDLLEAGRRGKLGLIKKYTIDKGKESVELYDAQAALVQLAKLQGLGAETAITKYLDVTKLSPAQLQRLANGDDPLAVLLATSADSGTGPA